MRDLTQALRELVLLFEKMETPYAVMGGIAVRVYGIPRATHDIDFTLAIDRDRLRELYQALSELGYTIPETYTAGWVNHVAGMPLVKARLDLEGRGIDIDLFLAESPFQQQLLARRRREELDNFPVWFVSPEDLILLKLLSHRPRDVADIGDILFTQGQLDDRYMRHWVGQLGVAADLEQILTKEVNADGK
jgi:hypothetical protein